MTEKMDEQPSSSADTSIAQRNWEMSNKVVALDSIYEYNETEQEEMRSAKPWEKDQHFFKEVKISAVALLKMVMHAKRGGNLEVMGLMQGRVEGNAFIVLDSFALPVVGTETRVNAQSEAYEYMVQYMDLCEQMGHKDKVVGWYHSHPGYGCWLSGIDVSTQALNQQYQEPWVAIVIDPLRTMSAGKVDIGAFRTYPKGYNPPEYDGPSEYQSIPLSKLIKYGHMSLLKQSKQDTSDRILELVDAQLLISLWNTYWLSTLSSCPLLTNAGYINNQIADLASKFKAIDKKWTRMDQLSDAMDDSRKRWPRAEKNSEAMEQLEKAVHDARTVSSELRSGIYSQYLKRDLFGHRCCGEEAHDVAMADVSEVPE